PIPIATFRSSGRFFSSASLYLIASCGSLDPSTFTPTDAGEHSACAVTFASQCALQSALICGGFISPVHLGAVIVAEHPPLHVPLHEADAFSLQVPPQLPLQLPWIVASHLPSQVP